MTKIITACFGKKFLGGVQRLGEQVEALNCGYTFGVITESTIKNDNRLFFLNDFFNKNRSIENFTKGYYWYVWKPWILLRSICNLKDNEVLVYIDAGTELSFNGKKNFKSLILKARETGSVFFRNPQLIKDYTKPSVLIYFEDVKYDFELNQVAAGILFLRNDKETRSLLKKWCRLSLFNNGELFNDEGFVNHRHDQSILSIIIQEFNFQIVDYPIWFQDINYFIREIHNYPIHTIRNPTNTSLLKIYYLISKIPHRIIYFNRHTNYLFFLVCKLIFNFKKRLWTNIVWNEHWNLDSVVEVRTNNFFHRTVGDNRQNIYPIECYKEIKFIKRNIIIHQHGLYKDLINDVYYLNQIKQFGKNNLYLKINRYKELGIVNCLPLLSLHDNNVFHFIYDLFYKALYLKKLNIEFECLIKEFSNWKLELIKLFDIKFNVINSKAVKISEAFIVTTPIYSGRPSPEVISLLVEASKTVPFDNSLPKRILIFRNKAKTRKVVNDHLFLNELRQLGFISVDLEDLSVLQQIQLFKSAEIIIAAHGAGLTWIFACRSECLIIEIFSKNYLNHVYSHIAMQVDIKYRHIIGESNFSRNISDPDIFLTESNKRQILSQVNSC